MCYFVANCLFKSSINNCLDRTEVRFFKILHVSGDEIQIQLVENLRDGVYITPLENDDTYKPIMLSIIDFEKTLKPNKDEIFLYNDGFSSVYLLQLEEYCEKFHYTDTGAKFNFAPILNP